MKMMFGFLDGLLPANEDGTWPKAAVPGLPI